MGTKFFKHKLSWLLPLSSVAILFNLTSCSYSGLMSRTINIDNIRTTHTKPRAFYHNQSWYQDTEDYYSNIDAPTFYYDKFGNFQSGVIMDESEQIDRYDTPWHTTPETEDYYQDSWTFYMRDGKGGNTTDDTIRPRYFDWKGNALPEGDRDEFITGEGFVNDILWILDPSNSSDTGPLWTDILYNGDNLVDLASKCSTLLDDGTPPDPAYNYLFDCSHDKDGKILTGDALKIKTAVAKINLKTLLRECLYGQVENSVTEIPLYEGFHNNQDETPIGDPIPYKVPNNIKGDFTKPAITWTPGIASGEGDHVQIFFNQPADFFQEILSYDFSGLTPFKAIHYTQSDTSGISYGTINGWKDMLYSGPYLIEKYSPNSELVWKRNENYWGNQENGNGIKPIKAPKKQTFIFTNSTTPSSTRLAFTSGDIDDFTVSPADKQGWKEFVGNNVDQPKFGAVYNQINPLAMFTSFLIPNIAHVSGLDQTDVLPWAIPSVRAYVAFMLNSNYLATYYGQAIDISNNYSPQFTVDSYDAATDGYKNSACENNALTGGDTYAVNGRANPTSYTEYINELLGQGIETPQGECDLPTNEISSFTFANTLNELSTAGYNSQLSGLETVESRYLADNAIASRAKAAFRFNPFIALNAFRDIENNNFPSEDAPLQNFLIAINSWVAANTPLDKKLALDSMVRILTEKVSSDLQEAGLGSSANLEYLINGATISTTMQNEKDMINSIMGYKSNTSGWTFDSPLKFNTVESINSTDFVDHTDRKHDFGMCKFAWGPDFSDPMSTLSTITKGGVYARYSGFDRILDVWSGGQEVDPSWWTEIPNNDFLHKCYINLAKGVSEYFNFYTDATRRFNNSNDYDNNGRRFQEFANAEIQIVYGVNLAIPTNFMASQQDFCIGYKKADSYLFNGQLMGGTWHGERTNKLIPTYDSHVAQLGLQYATQTYFLSPDEDNIVWPTWADFVAADWKDAWGNVPSEQYCQDYFWANNPFETENY